jgi:hypothetical protein
LEFLTFGSELISVDYLPQPKDSCASQAKAADQVGKFENRNLFSANGVFFDIFQHVMNPTEIACEVGKALWLQMTYCSGHTETGIEYDPVPGIVIYYFYLY